MPMEKTFNAAEAEPRITKAWEEAKAFAAGKHVDNAETGSFCVMIPPPNVTGALHVGHAFNNTLQDILTRWHRMRGFDTLWQPGQDHAGIATQLQVEKKMKAESNMRRTDLTREEFQGKVWDWKTEYAFTIIDQLKRLGCSCDWDRNAFTMAGAPGDRRVGHENSPNFHDAVIKVFVELYNQGKIYRGKRLVNWDPHFETAISDLEVENIETPGHMWHFKYPLADGVTYEYVEKDEDGNVTLRETRDYISIATTRPETMLGDGAVAVHPKDERYAPIVGKLCEIPVGPKEHRRLIPIITDEYPDPEFGSGAVKITGAHDFNDYAVAKRGGIPCYRLMDTKGAMRADGAAYAEAAGIAMAVAKGERSLSEAEVDAVNLVPDELRGLDRFEARDKVVAQITSEGLAVMTAGDDPRLGRRVGGSSSEDEGSPTAPVPLVEAKPIMQPFGDRSKVVIEPMLTDQWFVDAEKIVGPALDAVRDGTVKILPESGEKTYFHWLENIEPWCISRQLWWGHQIPVWYGPKVNSDGVNIEGVEVFCEPSEQEAIEQARKHYGGVFAGDLTVEVRGDTQTHGVPVLAAGQAGISLGKNLNVVLTREADVLDTWFSSGLWPIGTLGWPEDTHELNTYHPTSVLITGFDILFFWVARMMMMQLAVKGEVPFHTVYLHQLVRDEKGKKMSKTTGNVIDPLEIVDEVGADALRFTNAAMASIGGVLKLSKDRITGYRNFTTKLWNAVRFAEMNGVYIEHVPSGVTRPSQTANKWIIGETAKVREAVDQALAEYRFNDAASALYGFTWGKVCDWYVEFSKPLLNSEDEAIVAETRATMGWVLDQCMILLHPIMPFITEELWGVTGDRSTMLVHAEWPSYGAELIDEDADREMNWVISLIEEIRSARHQVHVPAGLQIPLMQLSLDGAGQAAWARNETLIKKLARVESLSEISEMPKGAITIPVEGGTFCLPLADIIDVGEEIARLEKSLGKLEKEINGLQGRLKNPKFAASAPPEVVEETRENAALREDEAAKLRSALDRLKEIG
ncbi:Valyl-tRNA synthetase [Candidatus Rhodobacter oscarellae]|uniref:Valine--tRNA ligase n=1 Tax=Candidatus Rhodobacter oscarellae TaxID=1675527 RepID=A0A0J9E9Q6_9RHOB|nr:valine--tRNA ligase [Candidatus Rhodobacter lobularis]KMW58399.1 Valyl-tRNA synthetase [Candidatus Rhodobacter lobularis]